MHAQGLGHEAVIEIVVALLGVMITILALMAGLIALLIAVFAFYGYKAIEEQAIKKADEVANRVAKESAESALAQGRLEEQSASLLQAVPPPAKKRAPKPRLGEDARRLDDASLKKAGKDEDRRRNHPRKSEGSPG